MATAIYDRVRETSTTTGTGTLTLAGAATGFRTFSSVLATNDTTYYCIQNQAAPSEWEVGYGTLTASTTLARTAVIASSNSNAAVSFSAGTKDVFITGAAGSVFIPPGSLQMFAGSTVPSGWLDCDGSAVSRTTYAPLFAAIGTTWGSGNGSTTFNVPDLRGRSPIGAGTGSGLTARTLAATGGEENHTLTIAEMPAHTHTQRGGTNASGSSDPDVRASDTGTRTAASATGSRGGDGSHNNMQPFAVVRMIVKT